MQVIEIANAKAHSFQIKIKGAFMKYLGVCILSVSLTSVALAQQLAYSTPPAQPTVQKSISSHLGLHAFPAKDQNPQQQQTDEFACYRWAKQDTGFDPLAALEAAQSATSATPASGMSPAGPPPGAGARGAARGAAAGAAVGAIAGDAGQGAAIGATSGGLRGRMAQKRAQAEAQQRAQLQAQLQGQAKAGTQASLDDFRKAYSACMQAKGYSVK
jgi:Glycine-zipper domain